MCFNSCKPTYQIQTLNQISQKEPTAQRKRTRNRNKETMSDNADILARRSSPKEHQEARKAEGTGLKRTTKNSSSEQSL